MAAAWVAWAPAAAADPAPAPPGYVECSGQLIPADPRLDVQNPLGAVMYRWFLQQMCTAGTPPAPPDAAPTIPGHHSGSERRQRAASRQAPGLVSQRMHLPRPHAHATLAGSAENYGFSTAGMTWPGT